MAFSVLLYVVIATAYLPESLFKCSHDCLFFWTFWVEILFCE